MLVQVVQSVELSACEWHGCGASCVKYWELMVGVALYPSNPSPRGLAIIIKKIIYKGEERISDDRIYYILNNSKGTISKLYIFFITRMSLK